MKRLLTAGVWIAIAIGGAIALGKIALYRGETISATWFVVAAICCYLVAYRLYSAFISAKLLALDDTRATPAERLDDGRDFVPTNRWVLFGHHFAAIAGPGPLVGPTLAAQFGYLPGTLWLIAGCAFAGCVQDFIILPSSRQRCWRWMIRDPCLHRRCMTGTITTRRTSGFYSVITSPRSPGLGH